jgi:hypothetical protein
MKSPKCGKDMDLYEENTSSGRDMRTYVCRPCKEYVDVDNGVALWQVLHDEREVPDKKQRGGPVPLGECRVTRSRSPLWRIS